MAYRWRNGRLMSDEEVHHENRADWEALVYGGAALVPALVTAYLGYRLGGKPTMILGAGVGAWLTWAFYGVIVKVWRAAVCLGIFLGVAAVLAYVFLIFWRTL